MAMLLLMWIGNADGRQILLWKEQSVYFTVEKQ